jgi:hypothetical protein
MTEALASQRSGEEFITPAVVEQGCAERDTIDGLIALLEDKIRQKQMHRDAEDFVFT